MRLTKLIKKAAQKRSDEITEQTLERLPGSPGSDACSQCGSKHSSGNFVGRCKTPQFAEFKWVCKKCVVKLLIGAQHGSL